MADLWLSHLPKLAYYAPGFLLRLYYTKERLAKRIRMTVRGEGEGAYFFAAKPGNVRIWLSVTNFLPFEVEVDRVLVRIFCGVKIADASHLSRVTIAGTSHHELLIEHTLSTDQLDAIARYKEGDRQTRLGVELDLNCKVRGFIVHRGEIQVGNVRFVNFHDSKFWH